MSKPKSNGRERWGRCHKILTPGAFSPSRCGKVGKWCRECFRAYRKAKKGANPTAKKVAPRKVKKAPQASAATT